MLRHLDLERLFDFYGRVDDGLVKFGTAAVDVGSLYFV
jgi:hypothetical protein